MWLSQFIEFKRNASAGETYNDFRPRYYRAIAKLKTFGLSMSDEMISHLAIQALKFPEGKLPIAISALKTSGEATSIGALTGLTIKMYETNRPITDHTDVYHLGQDADGECPGGDRESADNETSWEYTDESGQVFLMNPKKKSKGRNAPGAAEAARRGALANFRHYPNKNSYRPGKGKGKGPCLRCGDPIRWHRDWPLPWGETLDHRVGRKGKPGRKGKTDQRRMNPPNSAMLYDNPSPATTEESPDLAPDTPISPIIPAVGDDEAAVDAELNYGSESDDWRAHCYQEYDYPTLVRTTVRTYKTTAHKLNGHDLNEQSPLILLDSGASISAAGQNG